MTVYLVGAGPGDPGLLTVRGAELLVRAEVVVYDRLAESSLLDLAPAGAERIDVGKAPGGPVDQDAINALLVDRGAGGAMVVRLKGGDPFLFGRGGEEAAALAAAGVPFEVVPGVTSAFAVPAYAGVPVTHRGLSGSVTVVTGHSRHAVEREVNWEALAAAGGTIVVLMGVAHRGEIARRLQAGGYSPDTPVSAVTWGTRPEQHSVRTTLEHLGATPLRPPATIVVGAVAGLDLAWYERRPLLGRSVVVTRARAQASALAAALVDLGARPVEVPVIRIASPSDGGAALAAAAERLAAGAYAWVVLTSANGVERLCAHLPDARVWGATRIAAIGPGTAAALAAHGLRADLVPAEHVAEGLVAALGAPGAGGGGLRAAGAAGLGPGGRFGTLARVVRTLRPQSAAGGSPGVPGLRSKTGARHDARAADAPRRVLLARAEEARDVLPEGLSAAGWEPDDVAAYRTLPGEPGAAALEAAAVADAICFTSASTVTNYLEVAGPDRVPPVVACIGPVTAAAARAAGLTVDAEASPHSLPGLVDALVAVLSRTD